MIKALKDKKFLIFLGVLCVAIVILMNVLIGGAPKRHNNSLKKNMQKTLESIAKDCGLDNLEVVYVDDDYYVKVVLSCDNMSTISYDKKTKFFDDAAEAMANKGSNYSFYATDKVAVYSDGSRYTASADTLTHTIYENGSKIDPTTNKIKVNTEIADSSATASNSGGSSSSSGSSGSSSSSGCVGGVSCRSGYHPCHRMSNGYCNQCCKDS